MALFGDDEPSQDELMERQARQQLHQSNFGRMESGQNVPNKEYLNKLTENQLDNGTIELMQNLFSHDFMLSNLTPAEVIEQKWLVRVVARKIKRMHPDSDAFAAGETRKVVFDDARAGLKPLSPHQESLLDQAVLQFLTRPPRSREGWQQDEVSKQLTVSKVEGEEDTTNTSGLFGRS